MDFQSNMPIYLQLMDMVKLQIVSGKLQPGEKLASVRDLAMEYGVNPNTMQKALGELERESLVYTMRTAGRYVTEDAEMIAKLKTELAAQRIDEFFMELRKLGYSREEIQQQLKHYLEEMNDHDSIG